MFGTLGLIMIFTPGPGLFFIFIGLGLIAQESLLLAIVLDKVEVGLRKWIEWAKEKWDKSSSFLKVLIVGLVLLITALGLFGAYLTLLS